MSEGLALATEESTNVSEDVIGASWRALLDPRPLKPAPGTSPRELLALVDPAWGNDVSAWPMAVRLVQLAAENKRSHLPSVSLGAASIAYAAALSIYEDIRRKHVSAPS